MHNSTQDQHSALERARRVLYSGAPPTVFELANAKARRWAGPWDGAWAEEAFSSGGWWMQK